MKFMAIQELSSVTYWKRYGAICMGIHDTLECEQMCQMGNVCKEFFTSRYNICCPGLINLLLRFTNHAIIICTKSVNDY